jgi:AbrB family looped-hinge helix DNA binding protein
MRTPHKSRSTLTSKGQITLPVELRRRWGLKSGDRLDFTLEASGRVVLRKWVRQPIPEPYGERSRALLAPEQA